MARILWSLEQVLINYIIRFDWSLPGYFDLTISCPSLPDIPLKHAKKIWLAMNIMSALEVKFYVLFAGLCR